MAHKKKSTPKKKASSPSRGKSASRKETAIIPEEVISDKIFLLRGQKVMLDKDLADMYGLETKRLNEQVKRNIERFPKDFMFQLTKEEWHDLKSQNATSSWGGRRIPPYVFTEHGVLMLSSVLNSDRAIKVNIRIMRVYTKMKRVLFEHKDLLLKVEKMEKELGKQGQNIKIVFDYLKRIADGKKTPKPRTEIGYKRKSKKSS